jgi:hypothetical protein
MIETAEADVGDFRIELLGEFEAICETASTRESEPMQKFCYKLQKMGLQMGGNYSLQA